MQAVPQLDPQVLKPRPSNNPSREVFNTLYMHQSKPASRSHIQGSKTSSADVDDSSKSDRERWVIRLIVRACL